MKKLASLLFTLALSFPAFADCDLKFADTPFCADLVWTSGPVLDDVSTFEVQFQNEVNDEDIEVNSDYEVKIYQWMYMDNGMNHGFPRGMSTPRYVGENLFVVDEARFFMGRMQGYWVVRIDLLQGEELISRAESCVKFDGIDRDCTPVEEQSHEGTHEHHHHH